MIVIDILCKMKQPLMLVNLCYKSIYCSPVLITKKIVTYDRFTDSSKPKGLLSICPNTVVASLALTSF